MRRLIVSRVLATVPLLFLVSVFVFLLIHLTPTDPVRQLLGPGASAAEVAAERHNLGYDRPLAVQFLSWIGNALHGNLGQSLFTQQPVTQAIGQRLPITLALVGGGILVAVAVGIPAGVLAAVRGGSATDRLTMLGVSIGQSIPGFWLAVLLVLVFAVQLPLFPAIGYTPFSTDPAQWAYDLVLPSLALGLPAAATIALQTRGAMARQLQAPYIQALRAQGTPRRRILYRYALRNAMITVLTAIGWELTVLIAVSFVAEQVFAIPGTGSLLLDAVTQNDYPVVQGGVLLVACLVVGINLLVDLGYGLIDPKARPA